MKEKKKGERKTTYTEGERERDTHTLTQHALTHTNTHKKNAKKMLLSPKNISRAKVIFFSTPDLTLKMCVKETINKNQRKQTNKQTNKNFGENSPNTHGAAKPIVPLGSE